MAFLLDDILLAPAKGFLFIAKKIHETAMEEYMDEEGTRQELKELYMQLEKDEISEEEFEEREEELVDWLEQIEAYKSQE